MKAILFSATCVVLAGCGSAVNQQAADKVTVENFGKIKPDMEISEVKELLGMPGKKQTVLNEEHVAKQLLNGKGGTVARVARRGMLWNTNEVLQIRSHRGENLVIFIQYYKFGQYLKAKGKLMYVVKEMNRSGVMKFYREPPGTDPRPNAE